MKKEITGNENFKVKEYEIDHTGGGIWVAYGIYTNGLGFSIGSELLFVYDEDGRNNWDADDYAEWEEQHIVWGDYTMGLGDNTKLFRSTLKQVYDMECDRVDRTSDKVVAVLDYYDLFYDNKDILKNKGNKKRVKEDIFDTGYGSPYYNGDDEEECEWCGENTPTSELHNTNYGKICDYCIQAIKSRGEKIRLRKESMRKGIKEGLRFLSDPWKGRFSKSDNWVSGELEYNGATYKVQAKVFDEPSQYGINNGRISKLWVKEDGYPVAIDYDRGWVDAPPHNEDLLNFVMKEVEKFKDKHPTPKGEKVEALEKGSSFYQRNPYTGRKSTTVKDGIAVKDHWVQDFVGNRHFIKKGTRVDEFGMPIKDTTNSNADESLVEKVSPEGYAPKQTGKAYKVFRVKNGKLYPPMVANAGGADTPIGVWLDAEEGEFAGLSKTGRPQVKSTGSGNLAYRPGWHLGDVPRAPQFDRRNKETGEMEFPADFVWAECDYAMDIDYQPEADERGYMRTKVDDKGNVSSYRSDKYQHSLAGLPKLPTNGYYKYRTNPRPDTVPWVITGQMKVNRLLSDDEVNEILRKNGVEPIHRQGGDKTLKELGLKEGLKESLLKEDTQIWSSDSTYDYIWNADIEELKSQLDDMDVDYSDWDNDEIRNYLLDDAYEGEFEYEDFKYNLLPAIDNQCFGDVLVLFGDAANWRGTYAATKVLHKASDLEKYIYPNYDATTQISEDDTGVYYTQSTHDTPTGGTKMYLYSLKSETDLEELDKWCAESEWFDPEYDYSVDFLENNTDYKDIRDLIDKGILTPIKDIV